MSFHSWLQNLRTSLVLGRGQPRHGRRDLRRGATYRPNFEVLEDRLTPSFSPAASFPVGTNPQAIVAADFNNDGRLDLATANADSNSVSLLLGTPTGFGPASQFATGEWTLRTLAAGDFNNDGNLDLAAGASVLLGNGDGTFQAPNNLFVWPGPLSVAVGDFNADGNLDLVFSEDDWNSFGVVQLFLGDGGGGFSQSWFYTLNYPTGGLAVADVNGDGHLDAVTAHVYVLLGNGDGTLRDNSYWEYTGPADPSAQTIAVGDFTGDGIPDLVFAGEMVHVLPGRGDGWFNDPVTHSANGNQHTGVAVADFNSDGKLDAVTSDADTGTVSELLGNGNGTLTLAGAYAVGSSPSAISVGDFNADGRPDMAVANAGSNMVSVLLNNGNWTPPPPPPPALRIGDRSVMEGNTGTASATFTVILSAASTDTVTVAYATGNGTATAGSDYQAASGTLTFAPGETSKSITVLVSGDRLAEPNETFVVNLSGATNASIADGQGVGTIVDDEPRINITDVSMTEGKKNKTTHFTFMVTLSTVYDQPVTFSFATVNGTAQTSDNDYVAKTGSLTFAPGQTSMTITITVNGDNKKEANETFYLDLSGNSSNALFTKNRGIGTILNDD